MILLLLLEIMYISCSHVYIKLRPSLKQPILIKKPPKAEPNKVEPIKVPAQPVKIPESVKSVPNEEAKQHK